MINSKKYNIKAIRCSSSIRGHLGFFYLSEIKKSTGAKFISFLDVFLQC